MPKKPKLRTAKRRAWEAMSQFVRRSGSKDGYNKCVTCGRVAPVTELHAGHFIPKARGNAAYFHPRNVHVQCVECNITMGGNPYRYTLFMIGTYGRKAVEALEADCTQPSKFTVDDFLEIEKRYKDALAELEQIQAGA